MGKGYTVLHQKASLNVHLDGKIRGYTELTIVPTTSDLKVVWLNARSLTILKTQLRMATVIPLAFAHLPPPVPSLTSPDKVHTYPELKRSIWKSNNEGEEGELGISIPHGAVVKVAQPAVRTPATPKDKDEKKEDEWEQIVITIDYEVKNPGVGLEVVKPDEANPSRFPHVFTSSTSDIAARTWIPCSDSIRERCTWDLEFIVPRLLYSGSSRRQANDGEINGGNENEDDEDEDEDEWPVTVVASGELLEQVVHPERSDRVIWHFSQATPVSVQQIAWAVGPFVITEILGAPKPKEQREEGAEDEAEEDIDEEPAPADEGPKLHALCLPGRQVEMTHSVGVIRQAMEFYAASFGSYPFSTYTVAFVDSLASGAPTFHSAAMTLFSSDLLHPPSIIDQAYETRQLLAHALAVQWSGVNLIPRTPSDNWLVVGIALHITSLFLKSLWGNNEYRFRIKKDMIRCVAQDVHREPLSVPARLTQPEAEQMQFIALKAPLVLYILDKHLRKSGTSLGLDKVLPKLFLDAITGDVSSTGAHYNTLSTNQFLKTCRKACGGSADALRTFFDQWVYGSGCPTFIVTAVFNRKKMAIELNMIQECRAYNWSQSAPWTETGHLRPIDLFEGQMTIRIHEADGTPYEHVLNLQDSFKKHEVPFNTKYKRIRRNTKRYQARQAAATAAASGDAEAQEDMGLVDVGFGLSLWEEEKERNRWRVADWTEEDDLVMSQATYEWIRIDADLEWICAIEFEQPDFMWMSQLQRDRDVVAQLEAVHALSRIPSAIVSSNLCKTVLVNAYFFRIRTEAALALISCATKAQEFLGLFHLLKLFQTRYCFEPETETPDPFAFRCIPKTNNFRDLTEYFMKKALITAISNVRDEKGQTPSVVQQVLVDLLAYNDNLGNPFSDTFYVTSIMNALAHSFVAVAPRDSSQFSNELNDEVTSNVHLEPALQEIERYMSTDRLVPSFHNAITISGIEFKIKMMMASLMAFDIRYFFAYTRDGNYPPVRIAAFEALLLLNPLQAQFSLTRYFFAVLQEDSSQLVQRRLAQAMLLSLPVLAAVHDLAAPEITLEEEGHAKKEVDAVEAVLKGLRKSPGRSNNFRTGLLATLLHENVDPEVQSSLLKICEAILRAEAEPLPKIKLISSKAPIPEPSAPITAPSPQITFTSSATAGSRAAARGSIVPTPAADASLPFDITEGHAPKAKKPKKEKVPKAPKVNKATAGGLTAVAAESFKSMLKKLEKDKNSLYFRAPVDPVKSGAPNYYNIITNPMDLSTMSGKLSNGQYATNQQFHDDFKLIIANARTFNVMGTVVDQANALEKTFDKLWDRTTVTINKLETQKEAEGKAKNVVAAAPQKPALPAKPIVIPRYTMPARAPPPAETVVAPAAPQPEAPPAPPAPSRTVSFKLSLNATPSPAPQSVATPATPAPPTPVAQPVAAPPPPVAVAPPPKPTIKLKLGGSSAASSPATPAPPTPAPIPTPAPVAPNYNPFFSSTAQPAPAPAPPPKPAPDYFESPEPQFAVPAVPVKLKVTDPTKEEKKKKKKDKEKHKEKHKGGSDMAYGEPPREKEKPFSYAEPTDDLDGIDDFGAPAPVAASVQDGPAPPHPSKFVSPSLPVDAAKASGVIQKCCEKPEAYFFLEPVDPAILPTYHQEISHPMDLRTMSNKLSAGRYRNYGELFDDFQLIMDNCLKFNGPLAEATSHSKALERYWSDEWERVSKLSYNAKRSVSSLLKTTMQHYSAQPFLESIANILDQIPTYTQFVPRENFRDLGSIKAKVDRDGYSDVEQVNADFQLMIKNCMAFNPPDTPVALCGQDIKASWDKKWPEVRAAAAGKKRAGGEKTGGAAKKQKI